MYNSSHKNTLYVLLEISFFYFNNIEHELTLHNLCEQTRNFSTENYLKRPLAKLNLARSLLQPYFANKDRAEVHTKF